MYRRTSLTAPLVSPAQVWADLTTECQGRIIQLLARLASDLAAIQPPPSLRSPTHGDPTQLLEDPTGPP
jgi:hypothetical protein